MAPKRSEICTILAVVALLWGGATAQSSCMSALASLTSCLYYVTGNTSTPTSSCCSKLSSVTQKQPQCLCALWNARNSPVGRTVNQTLPLQLPGACGVPTPHCPAAASGPTTSASSENTPESTAPTNPSFPSYPAGTGTGSKTVPLTNGYTSGGGNIRAPIHLVVSILYIVSCASMAASSRVQDRCRHSDSFSIIIIFLFLFHHFR